jgi:hypothetical protein
LLLIQSLATSLLLLYCSPYVIKKCLMLKIRIILAV